MPRTTIFDKTMDVDELEHFERLIEEAWDAQMPILADRYGLDTLQEAQYRITLEVIIAPSYELDDGPLTDAQHEAIRAASAATCIPQERFNRRLF